MNRKQLITRVQRYMGGATRATASAAVEAVLSCIQTAAAAEKLHLARFGTFETVTRRARTGYNPATGAPHSIPAKRVLTFRPSSDFPLPAPPTDR